MYPHHPVESYDKPVEKLKGEKMSNRVIKLSNFPKKKITDLKNIKFKDINSFYKSEDSHEAYLSSYSPIDYNIYKYHMHVGVYPHVYTNEEMNNNKFIKDLFKYINIPQKSYITITRGNSKDTYVTYILIMFSDDLLVYLSNEQIMTVYYKPGAEKDKDSLFYVLMGVLRSYVFKSVEQNKIFVVYKNMHGFDKRGFNVKNINIDIDENYNDDFKDLSKMIILGLNDKDKTNLVILNGEPGVGKTTFIRYLTSKLKKNVIFIPPDMVNSITDPAFIPFLMSNNDSVLIIEDAEPVLEKRTNSGRSSAVSNVLNLTDGLLSDCLKISIVATFNTDKKTLDKALLRKGRLLMNYKFEKLSVKKSEALLEKLGHTDVIVTEPMLLSDIYFYDTNNNNIYETKKLGFK